MRAKLSYISEQTTMNWIESQIKQNDVVFDIGANVGAYSLLIGKKLVGGGSVLAFEPESSNFYSLNRNIIANDLSGSATHSVGKAESEMVQFKPEHVQGILTFSLDQFVEMDRVPFPNHFKIDVDGNEGLIIEHSSKTLSDPRLKSLVIEISENISLGKIEKTIESHGFQVFEKEEWKTEKHGTVNNILYLKNQQDHL